MRNKIGYVIIGILLGAIITSSIFLVRIKEMNERKEENQMERNENMLQQPNSEMMEPPEMQQRDNQEQPPEMPRENSNTRSQTIDKKTKENTTSENKI